MKNKKTIIVVITLVAALAAGVLIKGTQKSSGVRAATEGLSAPDFALQDMDGKSWRLSSRRGLEH